MGKWREFQPLLALLSLQDVKGEALRNSLFSLHLSAWLVCAELWGELLVMPHPLAESLIQGFVIFSTLDLWRGFSGLVLSSGCYTSTSTLVWNKAWHSSTQKVMSKMWKYASLLITFDHDSSSETCSLNLEHVLFSCMTICEVLLKGYCTEMWLWERSSASVLILSELPRSAVLWCVWLFLFPCNVPQYPS